MAKVTMLDIAEAVGVSRATVSYVLNGQHNGSVSPATCHRIQTLAKSMGYVPNRSARALAGGRTNTVALWTFDIAAEYYANVMGKMMALLRPAGYEALVFETEDDFNRHGKTLLATASPVDGIIAFDSATFVDAYLKQRQTHPHAIVSMGANHSKATDHVGIDLYPGAVAATNHLLATGRRKVAYLVPQSHNVAQDARYRGYTQAMRDAQLKPEYIVVTSAKPGIGRANARQVVRDSVAAKGAMDALFCFSDEGAIGAYRGLLDAGLRIPDDVALVGCNGDMDTEYLDAPISTLVCPVEEMCAQAWAFLQQRMAHPDLPRQKAMLLPKLEIRASSGTGGC